MQWTEWVSGQYCEDHNLCMYNSIPHIYLCVPIHYTSLYIFTWFYMYQHLDLASFLIVGSLVSKCLRSESQKRLWKKLQDQFQAPAGSTSKPQAGSPKSPHHCEQENTSLHKYKFSLYPHDSDYFHKFPILFVASTKPKSIWEPFQTDLG